MWGLINFILRNNKIYLFVNFLRSIKNHGFRTTFERITAGIKGQKAPLKSYTGLSKKERKIQENMIFPKNHKISIIVSLYNVPQHYLNDMMESVLSQTYGNWELCLVDGSEKNNMTAKHTCKIYTQKDKRIKYRKVNKSVGVSERLNIAIDMASGNFWGLLHQSDILHPSALYEMMKVICDEEADFIYSDEAYFSENYYVKLRHHKPDYAIDTLCSYNYISHFTIFNRKISERGGTYRSEFNGGQDYDLILRYTDIADKIYHIPKLLYFHRDEKKLAASDIKRKLDNISAAEKVITDYLKKHGKPAHVESKIELPGYYRVIYDLQEKPLVSIIIPNKDNAPLLRKCISSIMQKTTYENYEIIIAENNSSEETIFALYEELKRYENIHVIYWKETGFNFSKICNFGAQHSKGSQLIFLNNDIEIITPNWIEEMLMYSQRSDVGAVGVKLYYHNGSVQHAGLILGLEGLTAHVYHSVPRDTTGYMGKLQIVQNMSVVTAACMMIKKNIFEETGCFAPEFPNSFNDVDLCLKLRKSGYLIVWTPYTEAYHLESKSRGYNIGTKKRFKHAKDVTLFKTRWEKELAAGDPYYNCNFSLDKTDYSFKKQDFKKYAQNI